MEIPNTCFIIGSGASIRQNMWNISAYDLPIWEKLKNKFIVTLNWGYKFINPTIEMFADYQFYTQEKEELDKLNLIVGRNDSFFTRELKYSNRINDNLFLIPSAPIEKENGKIIQKCGWGEDSWKKGFYCSQLTGILSLSFIIALGCTNIYLLGYDGNETNNYTHFYQDDLKIGYIFSNGKKRTGIGKNEKGLYKTNTYNQSLDKWFQLFQPYLNTIKIWNVNLNSAISIFPKISYNELYKNLQTIDNINAIDIQNKIKEIIRNKPCN